MSDEINKTAALRELSASLLAGTLDSARSIIQWVLASLILVNGGALAVIGGSSRLLKLPGVYFSLLAFLTGIFTALLAAMMVLLALTVVAFRLASLADPESGKVSRADFSMRIDRARAFGVVAYVLGFISIIAFVAGMLRLGVA